MAGRHVDNHTGRHQLPSNKEWCDRLADELELHPVFVYRVFLANGGNYKKVREYCLDVAIRMYA